jgi:hypothetical protein
MPRRRNRLYFSCKRYRAHDGQIRPFTPVNPIVTFPPKFVPIGSPSHLGSLSLLGHLEHASFSNLAGGHLSSRVIPLLRPLKARPPLSLSRAPGPARSGPRLLGLQIRPARYALFPEAGFRNAAPSWLQLFSCQRSETQRQQRPRRRNRDPGRECLPPPPSQPPPGTRERARMAHAPALATALPIGCADRRHGEDPGGRWELVLRACAGGTR